MEESGAGGAYDGKDRETEVYGGPAGETVIPAGEIVALQPNGFATSSHAYKDRVRFLHLWRGGSRENGQKVRIERWSMVW